MSKWDFLYFSLCLYFMSSHWAPPRRAWLSSLPMRYLYPQIRSHWAFSSPCWTVPAFIASPCKRVALLITFMALHWTLFSMSLSLSHWGAQHQTQDPDVYHRAEQRGRITFLGLLVMLCLMQLGRMLAVLGGLALKNTNIEIMDSTFFFFFFLPHYLSIWL